MEKFQVLVHGAASNSPYLVDMNNNGLGLGQHVLELNNFKVKPNLNSNKFEIPILSYGPKTYVKTKLGQKNH